MSIKSDIITTISPIEYSGNYVFTKKGIKKVSKLGKYELGIHVQESTYMIESFTFYNMGMKKIVDISSLIDREWHDLSSAHPEHGFKYSALHINNRDTYIDCLLNGFEIEDIIRMIDL